MDLKKPITSQVIDLGSESRHIFVPHFGGKRIHILHVGCGGGTGGVLASNILKIMGGLPSGIIDTVSYTGIDGDVFETKNLGRQMCIPPDIGKNKAAVIVGRYAAAFGVKSSQANFVDSYITTAADLDTISRAADSGVTIVVDSVDRNKPRLLIHNFIKDYVRRFGYPIYSVSCGNGEWTGQVCFGVQGVGTSCYGSTSNVRSCNTILSKAYTFNIPLAFDLMPELTDLELDRQEDTMSCAERAVHNVQTLIANNMGATFALNYVAMLLKALEIRFLNSNLPQDNQHMMPTIGVGLTRYNSLQNSVHQLNFTDKYLRGDI